MQLECHLIRIKQGLLFSSAIRIETPPLARLRVRRLERFPTPGRTRLRAAIVTKHGYG